MVRGRISYANVTSTLALFAALGGTSYAVSLPRRSVGPEQLRHGSVRSPAIRDGAVRSRDIRNRTIALNDLSKRARTKLRGAAGPPGTPGQAAPSLYAVVDSTGGRHGGNGLVRGTLEFNTQIVSFPRSVVGCALVATPTRAPDGVGIDAFPGATVIVSRAETSARVETFGVNNQPQALPFALIAAC